jgi:hypothetical protein
VAAHSYAAGGRPLRDIMRQPVFIVAAGAGALGYGVMNLLMAATPLAMGVLVTTRGWSFLNLGSLVPVVLTGVGLAWLGMRGRGRVVAA